MSVYDQALVLNRMLDKNIPKIINADKRITTLTNQVNDIKQQEIDTQKLLVMEVMPMLNKLEEDINDIINRLTALESANSLQLVAQAERIRPLESANGLRPLENDKW